MNQNVLITGASTGLGLATALHLAKIGFRVYATSLSRADRQTVEDRALAADVTLRFLQLDITNKNSIDAAIGHIIDECGEIFALVNNAGTRLRGCFEDLQDKEIRRLFKTNVFGTMAITRAVLPYMREVSCGRIIMITSVAGKIGSFGLSAYCASKFSQEGFTESIAQELLPFGIRLSIIEPGIINTEAWTTNRVIAKESANHRSPYFNWFQRMEALSDQLVRSSRTTSLDVAKLVEKALTAKRPKLRYMVGNRAKVIFMLRRYLPGEIFDRFYFNAIMRKITGKEGCY
ncbi:MAG: SDR family oxidoreductase [Desulfobacteraceae bacterium]|jgi:NAD(P)-dependent dehydrogenase (short-subunit alcohol dehydrogenase family)